MKLSLLQHLLDILRPTGLEEYLRLLVSEEMRQRVAKSNTEPAD
jgi:hypothetical protein